VSLERLGACAGPKQHNPFNGLNVGIVHVEEGGTPDEETAIRFELITYDEAAPPGGAARAAFDSGPL
jgi:hypothetical protein